MRIKVAYVELLHHMHIANTFIELSKELEDQEWTFFFSDDQLLAQENSRNQQLNTKSFLNKCLAKNKKAGNVVSKLTNFDVVIFGTLGLPLWMLPVYYWIWRRETPVRVGFILHNAHEWDIRFFSTKIFFKNMSTLKGWFYNFNWLFKISISPLILDRVDFFFKLDESILVPKKLEDVRTMVLRERFFDSSKADLKEDMDYISFGFPGSVDFDRRDYREICRAIKIVSLKTKRRIIVVFAGISRSQERNFLQELLRSDLVEIRFYENKLDESEYMDVLAHMDYLVAPLKNSPFYGFTKVSGIISDALSLAKPILIPDFLPFNASNEKYMIKYNNKNVANKIEEIVIDYYGGKQKMTIMRENAKKHGMINDKHQVAKKLQQFLMEMS